MNITTRIIDVLYEEKLNLNVHRKQETHKNSKFWGGNETRISNNSRHQQAKSGIKKGIRLRQKEETTTLKTK